MTLDEIKQLIQFIREQELTEFELEMPNGVKVRVKSGSPPQTTLPMVPVVAAHALTGAPVAPVALAPGAAEHRIAADAPGAAGAPEAPEDGPELAIVKSPIVGTFYRAAEPNAKSFVEVGDTVRKGQVLCIIEAMKLMNEIDSEYDGEIVNIYVENGQAVQYGERLFAIRLK